MKNSPEFKDKQIEVTAQKDALANYSGNKNRQEPGEIVFTEKQVMK
jgi:hypothetical protein